jgi:hypothetical protein
MRSSEKERGGAMPVGDVAFSDAALITENPVDGHVYELPSDVAISAAAVARGAMADP